MGLAFMAAHRPSSDVGNMRFDKRRAATTIAELMSEARATQSISEAPSKPPSITAAIASTGCKGTPSESLHSAFQSPEAKVVPPSMTISAYPGSLVSHGLPMMTITAEQGACKRLPARLAIFFGCLSICGTYKGGPMFLAL